MGLYMIINYGSKLLRMTQIRHMENSLWVVPELKGRWYTINWPAEVKNEISCRLSFFVCCNIIQLGP